jgi:hypothetical protein
LPPWFIAGRSSISWDDVRWTEGSVMHLCAKNLTFLSNADAAALLDRFLSSFCCIATSILLPKI